MEIVLIAGLLFLMYRGGAFSQFGVSPATTPGFVPTGQQTQQQQQAQQLQLNVTRQNAIMATGVPISTPEPPSPVAGLAVQSGASIGTGVATAAAVGGSLAVGALTAGIGAAVTIFTVLWGRHELRIKQAKSENSAMNLAVQGFDTDIQLVNNQYNARLIDEATAVRALQQIEAQYWALVGPYIQPGRNGCSSGENCGPMLNVGESGKQNCTGDIGAACCVGCNDIYNSLYDSGSSPWVPKGPGAITVLQAGGGISQVKTIYGNSSYGGQQRNGYALTWAKVATA